MLFDKDWEVSAAVGVNLILKKIHLGVRYSMGLTNIGGDIVYTDQNGIDLYSYGNQRNRVLQLSLGYQIL